MSVQGSKKEVFLDARSGGFGDVWMRLVGLHAAAALRPGLLLRVALAPTLDAVARRAFAGRIDFVTLPPETAAPAGAWVYTNRGVRDLLPGLLKGTRYAAPLHRVVAQLKGRTDWKAKANDGLFSLLDLLGRVAIAPAAETGLYFGRLETAAIPILRGIDAGELLRRIAADFAGIREGLQGLGAPMPSPEPGRDVLVFPSGKGHQYMPAAWAAAHLPGDRALFAFHAADAGAAEFERLGLATARFAKPEEILFLARNRRRVVTTDSFPSHLLQYGCPDGTLAIVLTITLRGTVVTPGFAGEVFVSTAPCSPCPHRERGAFPLCARGFPACLTWDDAERSRRITAFTS